MNEPALFDIVPETEHGKLGESRIVINVDYDPRKGRHRIDDPETSVEGAASVAYRAGTHKAKLLEVFAAYPNGLTDEEAAEKAGLLRAGYWKRCGELREDGFISPNGQTRVGEAGVSRMVSVITDAGLSAIARIAS